MKTKNYTDKSAMLVGTDADPVTVLTKTFCGEHTGTGKRKCRNPAEQYVQRQKPRTHR